MLRSYACMPPISASLRRRPSQPKFIPGLSTLNETEEDEQDDVSQPVASVFSGDSDVGAVGGGYDWSEGAKSFSALEPQADYTDEEDGIGDAGNSDEEESQQSLAEDIISSLSMAGTSVVASFNQECLDDISIAEFDTVLPGYCVPLVVEWLLAKESNVAGGFFEQMTDVEEQKNLIYLAAEKMRNPDVITERIEMRGFGYESTEKNPSAPGMYWLSIDIPEKGPHSIGVHIPDNGQMAAFFDPNAGEFSIPVKRLKRFIKNYLGMLYGAELEDSTLLLYKNPES